MASNQHHEASSAPEVSQPSSVLATVAGAKVAVLYPPSIPSPSNASQLLKTCGSGIGPGAVAAVPTTNGVPPPSPASHPIAAVGGIGAPVEGGSTKLIPPHLTMLLADYLKQQQQSQQHHHYQTPHQPQLLQHSSLVVSQPPVAHLSLNNDTTALSIHSSQQQQQQQHLLASALLLSSVNPTLVAVMAQALAMQQQPQQLLHQLQQLPPTALVGAVSTPTTAVFAPLVASSTSAAVALQHSHSHLQQQHHQPQQQQQQQRVQLSISSTHQGPMSTNDQGTVIMPPISTATVPAVVSDGKSNNNNKLTKKKNVKKTAKVHSSSSSIKNNSNMRLSTSSSSQFGNGGVVFTGAGVRASGGKLVSGMVTAAALTKTAAAAAAASASTLSLIASSAVNIPLIPITTMQRWSLEKLDAHIKQYRIANQAVPQAIVLLAADIRRKEEQRQRKRLANRKSACTSRAHKKVLIDEMTKENVRLRRQALILSYLPDPVIAIRTDGVITFCSMQVERVLRHDVFDLVGANIEDILVPNSRESIRRLISNLVLAEQRASMSEDDDLEEINRENRSEQEEDLEDGINLPHEVSEGGGSSDKTSLPRLLEVKVGVGEDVSDSSGDGKNMNSSESSSFTHKMVSGEDKTMKAANTEEKPTTTSATEESDESSSTANKANANLFKNVEMSKINNEDCDGQGVHRFSHKDDVMGASVTANNADAKLSSLMHHVPAARDIRQSSSTNKKEQYAEEADQEQVTSSADSSSRQKTKKRSGNSSEDSGYRQSPEESNEYLEDSLSSSEASTDRSSSKKKRCRRTRPLAPACYVRLIRNDLSTIWCELTSSIRTRPSNENLPPPTSSSSQLKTTGNNIKTSSESGSESVVGDDEKELLLCFRPIREGEAVGEDLRFCAQIKERGVGERGVDQASLLLYINRKIVSTSTSKNEDEEMSPFTTSDVVTSSLHLLPLSTSVMKNRPPKKRIFTDSDDNESQMRSRSRIFSSSRNCHSEHNQVDDIHEMSVVESMMSLAKHTP